MLLEGGSTQTLDRIIADVVPPEVGSLGRSRKRIKPAEATRSRLSTGPAVIVVLIALALRLGSTLVHGGLGGILEYDDGVHLSASIHLLSGLVPYRDFTFVQPPGIVVLLTPFAGLARLIGEPDAMGLIRIVMALLGATNAILCARCAAPWGKTAALTAGLFYAVWPAAVLPERTAMLEPILTACVLGALLFLRRGRRWALPAAGVLLGLAISVKLVIAPIAIVIVVWVIVRRGWRSVPALAGPAALVVLAVVGPFAVQAPGNAWRMIVVDQFGRIRSSGSPLLRLDFLGGSLFKQTTQHGFGPIFAVALLAVVCIATIRAPRQPLGARLWLGLFGMGMIEILLAPDFYYHYGSLVAGSLAVLVGLAAARISTRASWPVCVAVLATTAVIALGFFSTSVADNHDVPVSTSSLSSFFIAHPCAMADSSQLIAGNDDLRSIRDGCATQVDAFGEYLNLSPRLRSDAAHNGQNDPADQALVQRSIAKSDGAVLEGTVTDQDWSVRTIRAFERRFVEQRRMGFVRLWVPRDH